MNLDAIPYALMVLCFGAINIPYLYWHREAWWSALVIGFSWGVALMMLIHP